MSSAMVTNNNRNVKNQCRMVIPQVLRNHTSVTSLIQHLVQSVAWQKITKSVKFTEKVLNLEKNMIAKSFSWCKNISIS